MSLLQDTRYSLRLLRKTPIHTLTTVFVLVIGLSLYIASYTMADMRTKKAMPFPNGDSYVFLNANDPTGAFEQGRNAFDLYTYQRLLDSSRNYSVLAAMQFGNATFSDGENYSRQFASATLSVDLLRATAVNPILGRMFTLEDAAVDAENAVLISYNLWQDYYGGNPAVVGSISRINNQAHNIIGVMPEGFNFPRQESLWLPLEPSTSVLPGEGAPISLAGILAPDANLANAESELEALLTQLVADYPDSYSPRIALVTTYASWGSGDALNMGVIALLIACVTLALTTVNLSSLLFMRSVSRKQELAVRASVGAGSWELVKQVLLESFIICAAGFAFSLMLSGLLLRIMESVFFSDPFWYEFELNAPAVLMGAVVTCFIWIGASATVAYRAKATQPASILSEGNKGFGGGKGNIANAIVTVEVVLSCFLLVLTGVLVSLIERTNVRDFGANTESMAVASIDLSTLNIEVDESREQGQLNYLSGLVAELDSMSDISEVAISTAYPGIGGQFGRYQLEENLNSADEDELEGQETIWVSDNYFDVIGVDVIQGRGFDSGDTSASNDVVILAEDFAGRLWADESPVGKRIVATIENEEVSLLVVGIIPAIIQSNTTMQAFYEPSLYRPLTQDAPQNVYLLTKYFPEASTSDLAQAVRVAGAQVDRNIAIEEFGVWDVQTGDADTLILMSEAFALAAFILASIGVFAVLSRAITQRTHEIGIRRALGSSNLKIYINFGRQGVYFLVAGLVLGCAPAVLAFAYLLIAVFDVTDIAVLPIVTLSVALLMGLIIAASCYVPTRMAIRLEPGEALHYE